MILNFIKRNRFLSMKLEKIILVGPAASGKDYVCKYLKDKGLRKSITYTTRPCRDKEEDDKDYHFIDDKQFNQMINENKFYEWDNFIGWFYGSSSEDFVNSQLFIKTPKGVSRLDSEDRKKCFIVYLDIPEDIIRERLNGRNDSNDSNERRIMSDKEDFKDFTDYDLRITDPTFDIEMIYDLMN